MSLSEISLNRILQEISHLPIQHFSIQEKDILRRFVLFVTDKFNASCLRCKKTMNLMEWTLFMDHPNEECTYRYFITCNHCNWENSLADYSKELYKREFTCICRIMDIKEVLGMYNP